MIRAGGAKRLTSCALARSVGSVESDADDDDTDAFRKGRLGLDSGFKAASSTGEVSVGVGSRRLMVDNTLCDTERP